jgi:hypothetical protein
MGAREQAGALLHALDATRPSDGGDWLLSGHDHALNMGIFPFFARANDQLFPLGTAFAVSKLGILLSAYHNVHEAVRFHPRGEQLRQRGLHDGFDLGELGLSVVHRHLSADMRLHVSVWPIEKIHGARPTDVIFAYPNPQPGFPYIALPLSFVAPRIGSRVTFVGYGGMRQTEDGLSLQALSDGDPTEILEAGLDLHVHEGRVTRVFGQRFAWGFIEGPCFAVDCEIPHGVSGGPVLNDEGFVCGIASAGASQFFGSPASIVSILSPTLLTNVGFRGRHGPVTINGVQPILSLAQSGAIQTDGTERFIPLTVTPEGISIGVATHAADSDYVHDDFAGFQGGRRATPLDRGEP